MLKDGKCTAVAQIYADEDLGRGALNEDLRKKYGEKIRRREKIHLDSVWIASG